MAIILDGTRGTTTPGLYSSTTFTGTYTDGIVVDYTSTLGRISVGTSDGLAFYNGGVATTELMRIDSAGNVGIGTNAPGVKLDVFGNASRFKSGAAADCTMYLDTSSTSNAAYLNFGQNGSLNQAYMGFGGSAYPYLGGNNALNIWNATASGPVVFATNNAERARIDSSGNFSLTSGLAVKANAFSSYTNTYSITTGGSAFSTGGNGLMLFYGVNGSFNIFWYDLVQSAFYGSTVVIAQTAYTGGGAAPTRTYSLSSGVLTVAISGGTAGTYTGHFVAIN